MRTDFNYLVQYLDMQVEQYSAALANWRVKFDKDPAHAFEWSDQSMQDAARREVYGRACAQLKEMFSSGRSFQDFLNSVREEFLRRAGGVASSTSRPSNVMDDYRRAAWTRLYLWLSGEAYSSL